MRKFLLLHDRRDFFILFIIQKFCLVLQTHKILFQKKQKQNVKTQIKTKKLRFSFVAFLFFCKETSFLLELEHWII